MQYNIHPIIVHFPIALLFIYSVIKILPLKRWVPRIAWNDIRIVLLVLGILGAFAAIATGDIARHLTRPNRALVNMHSSMAYLSTWLYGALLLGELAVVLNRSAAAWSQAVKPITLVLERILGRGVFSGMLAFVALTALALAGMLGGAMVYGTTADPFAATVLKMLGLSI